jgi:hypothetical protein
VTLRLAPHVAVAPLIGLIACANVWGFQDLTTESDGGLPEAAAPTSDAPGDDAESSRDAAQEASGEPEDSAFLDARDDARSRDAGAPKADGGANDGGDDGAAAACRGICVTGCCDSNNICQAGTSTSACGSGGVACEACSCKALQLTCCVRGGCACETSLACL